MAIIKHKALKSSNYSAAIEYLEYEHEESGQVKRDASGVPVLRDNFLIEGINCEPASFNAECHEVNELFNKNKNREEVKSHSYIISFDPRDQVDNGLTMQEVQQFGMEFANKYLPGYQTIVCTHADGNNRSGNLHCHIVINSIRIMDVPRETYMNRPSDNLKGVKHRCTDLFEHFIKTKVMEMCQERGLYQVNLLGPAAERITDREYYLNLRMKDLGEKSFQTKKEYIRCAIRECAAKSNDLNEFQWMMKNSYDIAIRISRGRLSFLLPDRERGITERQLGTIYTKNFIEKVIRREEFYYDQNMKDVYRTNDYIPASVKKLVNLLENTKAQQSKGYAHAVVLSNLKKSAETMNLLSEKNIKGMQELDQTIGKVRNVYNETTKKIKTMENRIAEMKTVLKIKEEREQIWPIIKELKSGKASNAYRKEHEPDLIIYKAVSEKLKQIGQEMKGFSVENLKSEITLLSEQKNDLYEQRSLMKKDMKDLENAKYNIRQMTERERFQGKERGAQEVSR